MVYYHITVEIAYGLLTGTKRWSGCGDASLEGSRSGKPLPRRLEPKPKGLPEFRPARGSMETEVIGIKTDNAFGK